MSKSLTRSKFQIWSNKHGKWWRPDALGYTDNQDEAGWFGHRKSLEALISSAYGSAPGSPGLELVDPNGMRFTLEFHRPEYGEVAERDGWRDGDDYPTAIELVDGMPKCPSCGSVVRDGGGVVRTCADPFHGRRTA